MKHPVSKNKIKVIGSHAKIKNAEKKNTKMTTDKAKALKIKNMQTSTYFFNASALKIRNAWLYSLRKVLARHRNKSKKKKGKKNCNKKAAALWRQPFGVTLAYVKNPVFLFFRCYYFGKPLHVQTLEKKPYWERHKSRLKWVPNFYKKATIFANPKLNESFTKPMYEKKSQEFDLWSIKKKIHWRDKLLSPWRFFQTQYLDAKKHLYCFDSFFYFKFLKSSSKSNITFWIEKQELQVSYRLKIGAKQTFCFLFFEILENYRILFDMYFWKAHKEFIAYKKKKKKKTKLAYKVQHQYFFALRYFLHAVTTSPEKNILKLILLNNFKVIHKSSDFFLYVGKSLYTQNAQNASKRFKRSS